MMRYMAAVPLLLAAMSAQNTPTANRGRHLDIPAISREANGSIVSIVMSDKDGHPIAQGSGFLISKDGHVVTNYHVIKNGDSALVKLPNGSFFVVDGVLASDKSRDVAIIKANGTDFRPLTLGDSDRLQVGEEVVAIGNPLSLESTVSNGIVSAIRTVDDEGGKFVQITAPISPGSSGGPLFNMAGEVIGITTSHLKGGENLNFAIPINDVKPMLRSKVSTVSALPDEPEDKTTSAEQQPDLKACHPQIQQLMKSYPAGTLGRYDLLTERCYFVLTDVLDANDTAPQSLRTIVSNIKTFSLDPGVIRDGGIRDVLIFDVTGVSFHNARLVADYIRVGNAMGECQVTESFSGPTECYTQSPTLSRQRFDQLIEKNFGIRW